MAFCTKVWRLVRENVADFAVVLRISPQFRPVSELFGKVAPKRTVLCFLESARAACQRDEAGKLSNHARAETSPLSYASGRLFDLCFVGVFLQNQKKGLLKYTDENHVDFEDISSALRHISEICLEINRQKQMDENVRDLKSLLEDVEGLEEVLKESFFVHRGHLHSIKGSTIDSFHYLLFSDLLVKVCKRRIFLVFFLLKKEKRPFLRGRNRPVFVL